MSDTTRLPKLSDAEREAIIHALILTARTYRDIATMMRAKPPLLTIAKVFTERAALAEQLMAAFDGLEAAIVMEETGGTE